MKKEPFLLVAAAAIFFALDAGSKYLAHYFLTPVPITVVPNFCLMVLAKNTGGSLGISSQYTEFCIALPATLMFILTIWFARRAKNRQVITPLMYLGFGLFVGGSLGNWAERVIYGGVTDFIHLECFENCIFNLADGFIDIGYLLLAVEIFRLARRRQLFAAPAVTATTNT